MEARLLKKIEKKIGEYYPGKAFKIARITKVKSKPKGFVFNILLENLYDESKEIYVKKFGPDIQPGINEILKIRKHWETVLTPRIIDYFEDDNVLLLEGVEGETLSRNFLLYSLGFGRSKRYDRLLNCAKKMGSAIGYLQRSTSKGEAQVGDMNIYIVDRFESENYIEILGDSLWNEMLPRVEKLMASKTLIAQLHGDPSPHNILMKGEDVFLLDFCYQTSSVYLDPILFTVYLDLVRSRFPFMKSIINHMKTEFTKAYTEESGIQLDRDIWTIFESLTYLHILNEYNNRSHNLKGYLVSSIDKKHIKNKLFKK